MKRLDRKTLVLSLLAIGLAAAAFVAYPRLFPEQQIHQVAKVPGLCEAHGVPEAQCPFCHPELVAEKGLCVEHNVPEALCYQCNPTLIPGFKATDDWCAGHDVPESQCPT